eukprot:g74581.t1
MISAGFRAFKFGLDIYFPGPESQISWRFCFGPGSLTRTQSRLSVNTSSPQLVTEALTSQSQSRMDEYWLDVSKQVVCCNFVSRDNKYLKNNISLNILFGK